MKHLLLLFNLFVGSLLFAQTTINYTESFDDIVNPERGFYHPVNGIASDFVPLDATDLRNRRENYFTPWNANYQVRTSVIFRHYVLDAYVGVDEIPQSFLDAVQNDFDQARIAGVKLMVRFSYTITANKGGCKARWICPPYGDAPKARVLAHIAQFKPILQNNVDVLLVLQNGFIGVWGEQYYTDYFGDASVNGQGKLLDENWQDRIDVVAALLDALPASRMVQVRYPQMKQKYIYGVGAPVTSAPMTASQAHNGSDIARIGFHNDCLLSASDDQGTYWDYGSSTTEPSNQTEILKPYFADDSKYVAVGGETCQDNTQYTVNNCESDGGSAVSELDYLNYTYLNSDYNNDVNNDWESGGCMLDIKSRYGYRFVLRDGTYPSSASAGGSFSYTINIDNVGFTAPFNPRLLQLVLRNISSANEYKVNLTGTESDVRHWLPGSITLNQTLSLPSGMEDGDYALFLNLPDTSNNNILASNGRDYSIQLANENIWEESTGYNKLNHIVTIGAGGGDPPAAPTNLSATAASSSQIDLVWDSSIGSDSYNVERSEASGGPYAKIATGITTTSYNDGGLSASTTFYYVVTATNTSGTSGLSNEASATTLSGTGEDPPAAPTNLSATAASSSQIDLVWDASTGADSYSVNRSEISGGPYAQIATGITSTSYSDGGLAASTVYYYVVTATNAYGTSSLSNEASGNTLSDGGGTGIDDVANGEIWVDGSVSGGYTETHVSDDNYESISEVQSSGAPSNRTSMLEHKWTINIAGGSSVVFNVEAYQTNSSDGDNFIFSYSLDDVNYMDMLTVSKTVDDNVYQTFEMPGSLTGQVYIKVMDTDRTAGNTSSDAIYIDHMFIRSSSSSGRTGTEDFPSDVVGNFNGIKVYPNPVKDRIMLTYLLQENFDVTIEVFDLLGKRKLQQQIINQEKGLIEQEVDLSELGLPGVYLVKVVIGDHFYDQLIIKQ